MDVGFAGAAADRLLTSVGSWEAVGSRLLDNLNEVAPTPALRSSQVELISSGVVWTRMRWEEP